MENELTEEQLKAIPSEVKRRATEDFLFFVKSLIIPSATGPRLFSTCIQPFQEETFRDLAPSIHAVREKRMPPRKRFWIERTKKASKDADVAICLVWLMAFPRAPIKGQICASNHRQAGIIRNRAVEVLYYNPWLSEHVEVIEGYIRNKKQPREVWCHIEATDSTGGAHGETPDILVLNELVHVAKWRAMEDHMQNADGTAMSLVIVATNAGIKGTPAWRWRKNHINSDRWTCKFWSKPSPWVNTEDVEEARKRDPVGSEYARLWRGVWVSGAGDAVSEDEIESCFTLEGPSDYETGWTYIGSLDLGVSHDHAGIVVLGINLSDNRIKVAYLEGWVPEIPNDKKKLEVDLIGVENSCYELSKRYKLRYIRYDPAAGGSFMAQRLRKRGVVMKEAPFSSAVYQTRMATCFVQSIKDTMLECYEDQEGRLRRDFGKFSISYKAPNKYKLEAVSDVYGHADVGVALVMVLPDTIEMLGMSSWLRDNDMLVYEDTAPMTENEVDELPNELRDIYELYGN